MATTIPVIRSFSSDSGVLGDGITNDNTLLLTGTAAANSTVKVYDGTTLLGSATTNGSGAWSFTTGTLSNSAHSFTAATTGGSTGTPSSGFPDASTTGVPAGTALTSVNGDFTSSYAGQIIDGLKVTGTITINNPDVIVRNCQAGQIVANADGATIEYCDVKSNGTGNSGIVILFANNSTVRGCDVSGYENSIWLEASGCKIIDNYIHDPIPYNPVTDPHIDGIQSPSSGGVANNLIQHNNINMGPDSSSCITGGGATNITINNNQLNGGTYTIYNGDNTGAITNNVFLSHQFGYVDGNLQTYSGNIDGLAGKPLVVSGQDLVLGTGTASAPVAADSTTVASAALVVTVDTVAPSAPAIKASTPTNTGVEVLTGTAEANSTVKVFDGATEIGTATANGSGAWSYATGALTTGSHSFTAKAMDAAGNTGTASAAAVVNIAAPTPAPSAPKIASFSNDSGVAGDGITNDSTLTLTGSAAANSTVTVFDGSVQIGVAKADSSGSWQYITDVLKDSVHVLTATATDSAGHASAPSAALAVTIDTHAVTPTMSVYSEAGAAVGSTTTLDDLVLKGTAEANSTIKVFDGSTQIGTATANGSGTWSFDSGHLDVGSHSFTSKAVDAAGNLSSASASANVGITAPPTNVPTADIDFTNLSKSWWGGVTISGTADANSAVKLYDGEKAVGSVTAGSDGTWTYTTKLGFSNTAHTYTAQEVDSTGNVVAKSSGQAILGSSWNNTLTSTAGDDLFVGNGGTDTFKFAANFGNDVIKDFDAVGRRHDVVEFSKSDFDSFASVLSHASQVGQDVVISAGSDSLTLKNTKLSSLDSHDFHFA